MRASNQHVTNTFPFSLIPLPHFLFLYIRFVTITGNPVAANYAQMLVLQKVPDASSV